MEPFIGQISVVAFDYAPRGWALCNGQLLSIPQNQALFSILGTTYGGNGTTTFALPDLRGRAAMHAGTNPLGACAGAENVQLNQAQIPPHNHSPRAISAVGTLPSPANNVWAASAGADNPYAPAGSADVVMLPAASGPCGSNQPHDNMPPVQVLNFIIALQGIFPSRS